jgi:N-acetylglucosaminyldiphosphoundecaprenol N-acetyl-beta-D-mannosaminyltransferase
MPIDAHIREAPSAPSTVSPWRVTRRPPAPSSPTIDRERPRNGIIDRVNVLGVGISAINMRTAVSKIDDWVRRRERHYVCVRDVHGVMECQRDPEFRRIHNSAGLVTPDGMPLVWLLRRAGYRDVDRVYGPDLMLALFERYSNGTCRHFFYGSTDDVVGKLREKLQARFPGTSIVGSFSPPFRPLTPSEDNEAVRMINGSGADIVWVGLGTPKQERWMGEHRARLTAPVLISVGAAFAIHAGVLRQAPYFIQRSGFEWLYRLIVEPRRLWRRYLKNNPAFVLRTVEQRLGLKQYSMDDLDDQTVAPHAQAPRAGSEIDIAETALH